jgi:sugar lactone lactonase YvrE
VLEIAHNGLRSGNPVGALIRVTPDGQRKELFPGALISPGGMAIGRDGSIYVTRFASLPDVGDVVRIQPE